MILIKENIMKNKSKIVSINLNEKDYKRLRSLAFKNEVSLSFFIRQKLGLEENKEVAQEIDDDIFTKSMNEKIEESKRKEEEKAKRIEELQRIELEKEQADFFNSSNTF